MLQTCLCFWCLEAYNDLMAYTPVSRAFLSNGLMAYTPVSRAFVSNGLMAYTPVSRAFKSNVALLQLIEDCEPFLE